ncbi:hypothetical protein D3C87_1683330 [compost metagenome]
MPAVAISVPSRRTLPELGSIKRAMQRARVDLPEPDSPTMPTISFLRSVKLTSRTACTVRFALKKPRSL